MEYAMKMIVVGTALGVMLVSAWPSAAQELPGRGRGFPGPGAGFGGGIDILRVEPLELSEPVVGAPFSAETVTEMVQPLADGNRIEQRTTGSVARDSRGRIRSERPLAGLGPFGDLGPGGAIRIVTITDPARREQYRLDDARKVAWRLRLPPPPPSRDASGGGRRPFPPGQTVRTESLEQMQFDGVKAEGTRTVLVLPAGTIGNERTIEVTSERWYAPELRTVVATKRRDPRFGDVSYRLVNIMRAEPPSHLFEVPPDFTVRDQPPFPPR
jgi:hypothetical protein